MEIPYSGRATKSDQFDRVKIVIPSRFNIGIVLFAVVLIPIGALIFGSTFMDAYNMKTFNFLAYLIPVILTSAFFFPLRDAWWTSFGREIIQAQPHILSIKRQGYWFTTKSYDLNEATGFRVEEVTENGVWINNRYISNKFFGSIWFEYGADTINFGEGLSEAEAKEILKMLKDKKILTAQNFANN